MIGRCSEMQKLSLDQVCELIDGVAYDIDLRPNQQHWGVDGDPLESMPTSAIIGILTAPPKVPALPIRDEVHWTENDWKYAYKQVRKAAKLEEWDEKHSKKISTKKANKKLKRIMKKLEMKD